MWILPENIVISNLCSRPQRGQEISTGSGRGCTDSAAVRVPVFDPVMVDELVMAVAVLACSGG